MRKIILFVLLLTYSLSLGKANSWYKVKKGDSFYSIAKQIGVSYVELAKLNGNNRLLAGQKIKVPNVKLYKVVSGDNIYRISNKLKISIKELTKVNVDVSSLYVGQLLRIPNLKPVDDKNKNIEKKISEKKSIPQIPELKNIDFIWPASGSLILKYDTYDEIMHYGLRLKLKRNKVLSMEKGVVSYLGKVRGLGTTLIISHANDMTSLYGGLKKAIKKTGDRVNKGDRVAMGDGILFFSIYEKGSPVDPISKIK